MKLYLCSSESIDVYPAPHKSKDLDKPLIMHEKYSAKYLQTEDYYVAILVFKRKSHVSFQCNLQIIYCEHIIIHALMLGVSVAYSGPAERVLRVVKHPSSLVEQYYRNYYL